MDASRAATLQRLFDIAVAHAQGLIGWFDKKAGERAGAAKRLRRWSIVLFSLGSASPVVMSLLVKLDKVSSTLGWLRDFPVTEFGYVLLAIAGALVLYDQFFDSSGSWIRFRRTEARLKVLLEDLRFAWARQLAASGGAPLTPERIEALMQLLCDFMHATETLCAEETEQWAERFSSQLADFDRDLRRARSGDASSGTAGSAEAPEGSPATQEGVAPSGSGPASGRPGSDQAPAAAARVNVRVAVAGVDDLEPGSLALLVDEQPVAIPTNGLVELSLEVGATHRIVVTGSRKGTLVRGAATIEPTLNDEDRPLAIELQ